MRWPCARPTRRGWASQTLSDLARHPRAAAGPVQRIHRPRRRLARAWPRNYGLRQQPTGLDHGLAYDAHRRRADRRDRHLHHRRQDRPPGPARAAGRPRPTSRATTRWCCTGWTCRTRCSRRPGPRCSKLEGRIDENAMIAMNARAELQGVAFDAIARDFLARRRRPLPGRRAAASWPSCSAPDLGRLARQHLGWWRSRSAAPRLVAIPLAVPAFRTGARAPCCWASPACCRPCPRWRCWRS